MIGAENTQLKSFIDRIEILEAEKAEVASDIRDLYAEAKSNGFDVKAMRAIVRLRKIDADQRLEQEAILETYMHALGMLANTELGQAAIDKRRQEFLASEKATRPAAENKITATSIITEIAADPPTPGGPGAPRPSPLVAQTGAASDDAGEIPPFLRRSPKHATGPP